MGLFYAYLKHSNTDMNSRYLMTFVDREAADEWWRMISTHPSPYAAQVARISPQFYTQTHSQSNVVQFFSNPGLPLAKEFYGKMFFTPLYVDGRDSNAPVIKITDHISGKWYFIRSQSDPGRYWYFCNESACLVCGAPACHTIHVSTAYRSRFSVRVRNVPNGSESTNLVMIGRDEVSVVASNDYVLHINDAEELKATRSSEGSSDILFGDLKSRFMARTVRQSNGVVQEYVAAVERGLGETWELVD